MSDYNMSLMPERVNEYIRHLGVVKDSSVLTTEEYVRDLRLFFEYYCSSKKLINIKEDEVADLSFVDDKIIGDITLTDLHAFLAYCNTDRGNSSVTRARKASSLRGFFKFVSDRMGYIPNNPASQLQVAQVKKKLPKYLTLEQSKDLLNAVEGENYARDYCILTLFLNLILCFL